ncbi:hypothetical protein [Raoultella ornithinolytica]|uniref:hypothetical protein n=1 Tax=Raoultella ornithinolytica TaxID=54291 RepID=UPI0008F5931C|nr:hypothetical protein [Raoultella ornithinolytica]APB06650.1 hypothetical protein BK817_17265 [Raoultella ornithinolytica]
MPNHPKISVLEMELYTKYGVYPGRFEYFLRYFEYLNSQKIDLSQLSDDEVSNSIWDFFLSKQRQAQPDDDYISDEEMVTRKTRHIYVIPDREDEGDLFNKNGRITSRGIEALRYFFKKWLDIINEK